MNLTHGFSKIAVLFSMLVCFASAARGVDPYGPADAKITIVVMDPMSLPLACDCVQGYAQRKYEKLADYLAKSTGQTVRVVWSESLVKALEGQAAGKVQIIIGKDSVVRSDAKKVKLGITPVAQLTDMKGSTMQRGLFVVRQKDKAATLLDLEGYKVFWGPEDCDEKSAAPKAKLADIEIKTIPGDTCESCSVAAKKLVAMETGAKGVAIISSYAEPLLAGCGTIQKGDLRVVGESEEVPFVSAFVDNRLPSEMADRIRTALLEMKSTEMLNALETKNGFTEYKVKKN